MEELHKEVNPNDNRNVKIGYFAIEPTVMGCVGAVIVTVMGIAPIEIVLSDGKSRITGEGLNDLEEAYRERCEDYDTFITNIILGEKNMILDDSDISVRNEASEELMIAPLEYLYINSIWRINNLSELLKYMYLIKKRKSPTSNLDDICPLASISPWLDALISCADVTLNYPIELGSSSVVEDRYMILKSLLNIIGPGALIDYLVGCIEMDKNPFLISKEYILAIEWSMYKPCE